MKRRLLRSVAVLRSGFADPRAGGVYLVVLGILLFLFPFGLFFLASGALPEEYSWTASVFIILIGVVTYLSELRESRLAEASLILLSLVVPLYFIELLGVTTGIPFGLYSYTGVLGLSAGGVPLAIPFAWYAAVMNSMRIAERGTALRLTRRALIVAALAGFLTVAQDVALEPAASRVELYWIWGGDGSVPLQNYGSWFVLTFLAVLILMKRAPASGGPADGLFTNSLLLYTLQWFLFAVLDVLNGYAVSVLLSLACIGAAGTIMRRSGVGLTGQGAGMR